MRLRIAGGDPVYPQIAETARIEGVVRLDVRILPAGTVESATVRAGQALLDQAAIDAVRQWRFSPLSVDGQPVTVDTTISIPFVLSGGPAAVSAIIAAADALFACESEARQGKFAEAVPFCQVARSGASQLPASVRVGLLVDAEIGLGRSLVGLGRSAEALPVLESARRSIALPFLPAQRRHVQQALMDAYASVGRLPDAVKACDQTENALKNSVASQRSLGGTAAAANLSSELKAVTLRCAELLDKAGKPKDAAKARERAAQIK